MGIDAEEREGTQITPGQGCWSAAASGLMDADKGAGFQCLVRSTIKHKNTNLTVKRHLRLSPNSPCT